MRYAIYLTPPPRAPLLLTAEAWLGRSAFGRSVPSATAPREARAEVPARYGFHATLRAPFALKRGVEESQLMHRFAASYDGADMLRLMLTVANFRNFVALTAHDDAPLASLQQRAMEVVDDLRAPLTTAEMARRQAETLDERGRALLERWGYPHVLERFVFHMTLSGPVDGDLALVHNAARRAFAAHLETPQPLLHALFREDEPGGPFRIIALQRLPEALT